MILKHLETTDEIRDSFRAFTVLRPHLDVTTFLEQAQRQMLNGYRILAVIDNDLVMSAAGYRFGEALAWGKFIYIDDLVTHPDARGKGYAGNLLNYIRNLAIEHKLDAVHLDSGHGRYDAHRLYLNHGFIMTSHHFRMNLK